jgi:hypothetical protein
MNSNLLLHNAKANVSFFIKMIDRLVGKPRCIAAEVSLEVCSTLA